MRRRTIGGMLCFLKYLVLFVAIDQSRTQAVRYTGFSSSKSCPDERYKCVAITSCQAALLDIKNRQNPTICGWASEIPLVCCLAKEDKKIPREYQKKVSKLSPKNCGKRLLAPPPDENGALVYPPSESGDILDVGIEPRRERREVTEVPERQQAPTFGDILDQNNFFLFAIGGTPSTVRWPWMVAIFNGNGQKQLCGGTLIDERHVISAAHCFAGRSLDPSLYKVQIGELYLNQENTDYKVKEIKLHEGYRRRYYYDDIAIIRLAEPLVDFTPACLPAGDDVQHGDNVTVLGWGDLSYGGPSTSKLQEVESIPIVDNSRCDAQFRTLPGAPFPRGITDTFLCAGLEEGGKDACQGDSGGPLLQEHSEEHWTLVGVVSFGYKCGEPGYPGVYTKISSYLPWIEKYIGVQNEVVARKRPRSRNFEYINGKPLWKSVTEKVNFPK